jgi:GNAT superfamily N-acetyltransferase
MQLLFVAIILLIIPIIKWIMKIYSSKTVTLPPQSVILKNTYIEPSSPLPTKLDYGLISRCSDIACYHSDIGTVYPLEVYSTSYFILPYKKTDLKIQKELPEKLRELHPGMSRDDILDRWKGSDIMYVMITSENQCIGSVAVDRKNFEPFISYLYVDPQFRKKGYGERLLQHGMDYAKEFKFKEVKLWCKEELIPYYMKYGWEKTTGEPVKDSLGNEVYVMQKTLSGLS